jgi:nicotinamidase-related amidase
METSRKSALIIIDAQQGIRDEAHWGGNRNNPEAEENIKRLLSYWREKNLPVIIVQHCSVSRTSPFWPDNQGNKLMDFIVVRENEKLLQKSTASAFIKTDLQLHLDRLKISDVVITGFVTNNSVEATARNAGDLGINTVVVSDATACFDKIGINGVKYKSEVVHQLSLANLKDEYATIRTTEEIIQKS